MLNKLRGFEVPASNSRILLIDVDTVVFGDLSPFADLGPGIWALTDFINRVPLTVWQELYPAQGLGLPEERVWPLVVELGGDLEKAGYAMGFNQEMPPYFNSGVILSPRGVDLSSHWARYIHRLFLDYRGKAVEWNSVAGSDQAALALAFEFLRASGTAVSRLPFELHARSSMFFAGRLSLSEAKLFHAIGLFRARRDKTDFDPRDELEIWIKAQENWKGLFDPEKRDEQQFMLLVKSLREIFAEYVLPAFPESLSRKLKRVVRRNVVRPLLARLGKA